MFVISGRGSHCFAYLGCQKT